MTKTLYINKVKKQSTLSPIGFKEDTIYQAHTLEADGLIPYVPKNDYDKMVKLIKETGNEKLLKEMLGK